jgi:hypothetical protein
MALDEAFPEQFVATLCAVQDGSMRSHLLVEKVRALGPADGAALLQHIIVRASMLKGDYSLALDALNVPFLTQQAGNPFMSDLYVAAQAGGFGELLDLLLRYPASRHGEQQGPASDVPAGVRVSMAKRLNRQQLARMLTDTNPLVIRTLLKNPSLTESDVLKLCSLRPASADVQREVFHSRKWSARYPVKKALIFNPYTPTELGLKLVHFMMEQDLRIVAESLDLHPALRESAQKRLESSMTADDDAGYEE